MTDIEISAIRFRAYERDEDETVPSDSAPDGSISLRSLKFRAFEEGEE